MDTAIQLTQPTFELTAEADATPQPKKSAKRATATHTILERSTCLVLTCNWLGNDRKVNVEDIDLSTDGAALDVDKEQLHVTKKLVDVKLLRPARRVIGEAKSFLRKKAIPAHRVFGERAYLIPFEHVDEVDAELARLSREVRKASRKLAKKWAQAIEAQRQRLGPLFRAEDYVSADDVKHAFAIDWSYVSFAAPERLEHVNRAIYQRTVKKFNRQIADAEQEVKQVMREAARKIVSDLVVKLTPGADGKRKVLRGTSLHSITEFIETFKARNLADDSELATLIARLHAATSGLDGKTLNASDAVRDSLLKEATALSDQIGALVVTAGNRGISFGKLSA